jgi:hypothetical protein
MQNFVFLPEEKSQMRIFFLFIFSKGDRIEPVAQEDRKRANLKGNSKF